MGFNFQCGKPSFSLYGKILLACSLLQALVVGALEIVVFSLFIRDASINSNDPNEGSGKSISIYIFIFIFTQIYQFIIILDAVWGQNTIQIFAHIIYCCCMVGFAGVQIYQLREAARALNNQAMYDTIFPYLVSNVVILSVFTALFIFLAFKLYLEFGWKIYKKIGADPRKREMFRSYQILVMLIKFALYFFLAFAIQFLFLVLKPNTDPEFGLTIVLLFACIALVILIFYGLKHENIYIMGFWIFCLILALVYFSFKIARIYTDPMRDPKYTGSGKFLTLFASLGLAVILATFVYSIICLRNFGKGLKDHLLGQQDKSQDSDTQTQSQSHRSINLV